LRDSGDITGRPALFFQVTSTAVVAKTCSSRNASIDAVNHRHEKGNRCDWRNCCICFGIFIFASEALVLSSPRYESFSRR